MTGVQTCALPIFHAEFATVGEAHGEMVAQAVEGPELGRQARRFAEAVDRCAILAHFAVFAGENVGAARSVFIPPVHLPAQQLFHQGAHADGKRFSALGIAQTDELEVKCHIVIAQFENLPPPHAGEKGQQEHIAHIAGGPCAGCLQKCARFLRRQVLDDFIVLDRHFDLEAQRGAAIGFLAEVYDAPQKLKGIPERGRFALAQGLSKLLHHLGCDFRDAPFAEQRFEVLEIAIAVSGQPLERRPFDVKIGIRYFGKGLVPFRLLPADLPGGFDFLAMPDGFYPLGADFRRHVRPIALGDFAYLFPNQSTTGFKSDIEAKVGRAVKNLRRFIHINASPFFGVVAPFLRSHELPWAVGVKSENSF